MLTKHQPLLFTLQTLIESVFTLCWRSWMEKIKRQVQATYQDSEDLRSSHKVELGIGWPYVSICPRSLGCVWCSDGIINSTSFTLRSVLVWIRDYLVSVVRKGSQYEVPLGNGGTIGCHSWAESWAFGSTGSSAVPALIFTCFDGPPAAPSTLLLSIPEKSSWASSRMGTGPLGKGQWIWPDSGTPRTVSSNFSSTDSMSCSACFLFLVPCFCPFSSLI